MPTAPTRYRVLIATFAVAVLVGGAGAAVSHSRAERPAGIDFHRPEALARTVELDTDATDALHDVRCAHVHADVYSCVGKDARRVTRTLYIRVAESGAAWHTVDDGSR